MSFSRCLIFLSKMETSFKVISLSLVVFLSSWLAVEISFCSEVISLCSCFFDLPFVFCPKEGLANANSNTINMKCSLFIASFVDTYAPFFP